MRVGEFVPEVSSIGFVEKDYAETERIVQDGRDVPDGSSIGYVEQLEKDLKELRDAGIDAQIASGGGRMCVTMDRYEVHPPC